VDFVGLNGRLAISIEDAKMICELNWNFPSKHGRNFDKSHFRCIQMLDTSYLSSVFALAEIRTVLSYVTSKREFTKITGAIRVIARWSTEIFLNSETNDP